MRQFKYRQTFATNKIKLIFPEDKGRYFALASLEALKTLLPPNLDIGNNPDLLFNSFNAAVVNHVNLNDDGIQTATALNLYRKFINKFCDLEHERSHIVGFIVNSGLSQFLTDKIITEAEARQMNTPFNISLGSVVWPVANPAFAEMLINSSDETSEHYQEISASWEIGFDEMHLAVGSRDLSEAEIITDPTHIEELKGFLKIYEGEGVTKENEPIYRIITGDAIPLGIAYTTSPAASVKGVIVVDNNEIEVIPPTNKKEEVVIISANNDLDVVISPTPGTSEMTTVTPQSDDKNHKYQKNISQEEKETVKSISNMKLTNLDDITDVSLKELSSAAVKDFLSKQISDKIDNISSDYANKLEAKENQVKEIKAAQEETQQKFEETQKALAELQTQLEAEQEARSKEKVQADFNARMADLDTKYDLDDNERSVIAKNIRGLDDEAYAEKCSELEILLAAKKKQAKVNKEADKGADEDKEKEAKASVEQVLDDAKEDNKCTPPNTPSIEKTLREEFADAFKLEDFKISVKR